jgi:hypothetical protein
MPKKSPEKENEHARLISWYKWEFLRRNAKYRRDHGEFMRKFGDWFRKHGFWYDQDIEPWGKKNFRFFARVIAPKAKLICQKWQVRDPYSPDWNFTRSGVHEYKPGWEAYLPTDCSQSAVDAAWDFSFLLMPETAFRKGVPKSSPPAKDFFQIRFNLRKSLPSLLQEAKDRITARKAVHDRKHPQPRTLSPAKRRRLDLYETYLKVWDLKRGGEKFEVIGALLFRNNARRAQRALDAHRAANKLINGGYMELR